VGGQERNEVNHVTGEGGSNTGNIICNNTSSPPGIRLLSYIHDLGSVKEEKTGRLERRGES